MPGNSRILTCSYNRRRNLIVPHNIDESTMQTTKPKLHATMRTRNEPQIKVSLASENDSSWSTIEKETRTPSLESELEEPSHPSIFRRRTDLEDEDDGDMLVLKRANPVYDSDDEEFMSSPPKRLRTSSESTVLTWDDRMSVTEDDFSLSFLSSH